MDSTMNEPEGDPGVKFPPTRTQTTASGTPVPGGTPSGLPSKIGRYRVSGVLGEGGFGRVYLGFDDDLDRPVAIKVPRPGRIPLPRDVEAYLTEARVVAR